mmetsp:Transcript_14553/g.31061  ORF Transcript_14553/g.31061 Transcript_14553/m.31061 type:complete len:86 (-) Transcript_14553:119-376(-)
MCGGGYGHVTGGMVGICGCRRICEEGVHGGKIIILQVVEMMHGYGWFTMNQFEEPALMLYWNLLRLMLSCVGNTSTVMQKTLAVS